MNLTNHKIESAFNELKLAMEVEKLKYERDKLLGKEVYTKWEEEASVCPTCFKKFMRLVWPCCEDAYWKCGYCGREARDHLTLTKIY